MSKAITRSIKIEGHEIHFKNPVKEFLIFKQVLVVLFQIPTEEKNSSQNIRAYDFKGNELWRIPKDTYRPEFNYVAIYKKADELVAVNFSTNQLLIEPTTGKVLNQKQVK